MSPEGHGGSGTSFSHLNSVLKGLTKAKSSYPCLAVPDANYMSFVAFSFSEKHIVWPIKAYFGIGEEASTLAQIADRMGIKRERARQIRDHALRKMRKTKIEE